MNVWLALFLVGAVAIGIVAFFWRATRRPADRGFIGDDTWHGGSDGSGGDSGH